MSRVSATHDVWHPQTREDREAILYELHQVLSSPQFSNSKRYPALLQYVVETTLAGKSELLKERTLGVEVFDRPPSYDTNTDTVVRYTAGEVRKRLSLYYHELDRKPRIQISLPAGSYVPEFLLLHDEPEGVADPVSSAEALGRTEGGDDTAAGNPHGLDLIPAYTFPESTEATSLSQPTRASKASSKRFQWLGIASTFVVAIALAFAWKARVVQPRTVVDEFWLPVIHDQRTVLFCTGGVVFAQNNFSGVTTAGKDIEYPFVSFQIASAISRLSGLVERNGATAQLQSASTTPLTELRERPIVLLGGYNNQWTMRLMESLPYQFTPESDPSIQEVAQHHQRWARDRSLPYSSADDYAIIARFRDGTTDSWVVMLAGLGRNGTEAAAQVATSPHYMQLLREKFGSDFGSRNVEAVLKVNVIEGKTGAPSILAVRAW
jgi:hypothetical protein